MWRLPNQGITLIEILITIAIIASISVVAIPNLRKLNQSQDLENATSDLVQNLRQVQTNAMTGASCLNNISARGWWVKFDPTTNSYNLVASCYDIYTPVVSPSPAPTPYDEIRSTLKFPNGVNLSAINNNDGSCLSNNLEVNFNGNNAAFYCGGVSLTSNPVVITLKDSRSGESREVKVDKGGSIERN